MNFTLKITPFLLCCSSLAFAAPDFSMIGFSQVNKYGQSGVTGGAGGEIVRINGQADAQKMKDALDDDDKPKIIYLEGTVTLPLYKDNSGEWHGQDVKCAMTYVKSNKSIIGIGNSAVIKDCGLTLYSGFGTEPNAQQNGVKNVIIRNIKFTGAKDDALNIEGGTNHVWVDHCEFANGNDGLLDIKRGSDFVTVSWCRFYDHNKTALVGHDDKAGSIDKGYLRVTYHHNWFEKTTQRHPRVRFGHVHVFNNLYDGVKGYGVASTCNAEVLVENCYFDGVKEPSSIDEGSSPAGDVKFVNCELKSSGTPAQRGSIDFDPKSFYSYKLDKASDVSTVVKQYAGVGKITVGIADKPEKIIHSVNLLTVDKPEIYSPTGIRIPGLLTEKNANGYFIVKGTNKGVVKLENVK